MNSSTGKLDLEKLQGCATKLCCKHNDINPFKNICGMIKFTNHYWRTILIRYTIEKFVVIKQPVKRNQISFSYLPIEKMY